MGGSKFQLMLDLYNALNTSPMLGGNSSYGAAWLRPTQILDGRRLKFDMQFNSRKPHAGL